MKVLISGTKLKSASLINGERRRLAGTSSAAETKINRTAIETERDQERNRQGREQGVLRRIAAKSENRYMLEQPAVGRIELAQSQEDADHEQAERDASELLPLREKREARQQQRRRADEIGHEIGLARPVERLPPVLAVVDGVERAEQVRERGVHQVRGMHRPAGGHRVVVARSAGRQRNQLE